MAAAAKKRAAGGARTYATWNPARTQAELVLSEGGLKVFKAQYTGFENLAEANQSKNTGKWYYELKSTGNASYARIGFGNGINSVSALLGKPGSIGVSAGIDYSSAVVPKDFTLGVKNFVTTIGVLDTFCIAVDLTGRKIWVGRNGTYDTGNPETGANPVLTWTENWSLYPSTSFEFGNEAITANFGATPFAYAVPAGFNEGWYEE